MKKILIILFVIFSFIDVYAVSSDVLMGRIEGTIFSKYSTEFNDYFDEFDVSDKDIKYVINEIDTLEKLAKRKNITDISIFEKKCCADIRASINSINDDTSIKIRVLPNGKLEVKKYKSNEIYKVINTHISSTGGSPYLIYIAFFVTVIGAILLVFRVRNA